MIRKISRIFFTFTLLLVFSTIVAAQDPAGGLGIKVAALETGELVILKVYEGYPANLAGLKPGDIITHVDGIPTEGTSYCMVVKEWIRGLIGEKVVLTIARFGEEDLFSVIIERMDISNMCSSKSPVNP
jgi:carboxyl-terminal processing protease